MVLPTPTTLKSDDFRPTAGLLQGGQPANSTREFAFGRPGAGNGRGFAFDTTGASNTRDFAFDTPNPEDLRQQRSLAMEDRRQEQRQLVQAATLSRVGWPEGARQPEGPRVLNAWPEGPGNRVGTWMHIPSGYRDEYQQEAAEPRRGDDVAD